MAHDEQGSMLDLEFWQLLHESPGFTQPFCCTGTHIFVVAYGHLYDFKTLCGVYVNAPAGALQAKI